MEFVVGDFVAVSFAPLIDAPGVHTELKRHGVDAAVVDHAYILSKLQLATALSRIEPFQSVTAGVASTPKQRKVAIEEKSARLVFTALSLTHNLDKVLQVLPPGPATSAVVVIVRKQTCTPGVLSVIRDVCGTRLVPAAAESVVATGSANNGGINTPHPPATLRSSAQEDVEAFLYCSLAARAEQKKMMIFYGITENELRAVRQGFTSQDILAVRHVSQRWGSSGVTAADRAARVDPDRLLDTRALELCVVNRLATSDV